MECENCNNSGRVVVPAIAGDGYHFEACSCQREIADASQQTRRAAEKQSVASHGTGAGALLHPLGQRDGDTEAANN